MVDTYSVSHDGLVYEFKLRDGLKWHNGKPARGNLIKLAIWTDENRDALAPHEPEVLAVSVNLGEDNPTKAE